MTDDLEARLKSHARSFDSLLSLIPAKLYYGEDNSDQWKRKKQTPEQKKAAKKAKLDPDNWKSAKDVADEREAAALKRKRESDEESAAADSAAGPTADPDPATAANADAHTILPEQPKAEEDLTKQKTKKRKTEATHEETEEERRQRKLVQKAAKRERKKEKKEKARLKHERWLARNKSGQSLTERTESTEPNDLNPCQASTEPKEAKDLKGQHTSTKAHTEKKQNASGPDHHLHDHDNGNEDDDNGNGDDDNGNGDDDNGNEDDDNGNEDGDNGNEDGDNGNEDGDQDEDSEDQDPQSIQADEPSFPQFSQSNSDASDDSKDEEVFSPNNDSGTSSISSIQAPGLDTLSSKPAPSHEMTTDTKPETEAPASPPQPQCAQNKAPPTPAPQSDANPKARLQAALSAFKSARSPSNPAKSQPKSRAQLLAQRRAQEERRKAEKKAQKAREKEEAARKQEEEIAQRFSPGGSGSLLGSPRSPIIHQPSPEAETINNNFSFGRIALPDGSALSADGVVVGPAKKKGPQDPRTALAAAQAKQARLAGLDADKRETIESKKLWANARKRAAGEKVRDDTSLLKKALKRHESQKRKSEKEWNERQDGVKKSIEMRQKKRTENLAKRREEKLAGSKGGKSRVRRPGFEGSLKGRTGKSGGKKKN